MLAMKGIIQGNTIVVDEDVRGYDGKDVIVTILDYPYTRKIKKADLRKYQGCGEKMFPSDAQDYIREMRDNDRV